MSEISKIEQNLIIKKIDNETVIISVNNNEMLMAIVGQFDQNLKNLSKLTDTIVFFRGNSITCKGDKEKFEVIAEGKDTNDNTKDVVVTFTGNLTDGTFSKPVVTGI